MPATVEDRYKLALEAGCHDRTVRRWLAGGNVHRVTERALVRAAKKLGIDAAPKAPEADQCHADAS